MKRTEQNHHLYKNLPAHVSRTNVLGDLGFSTLESAALEIKAELLDGILSEIHRRKVHPEESD